MDIVIVCGSLAAAINIAMGRDLRSKREHANTEQLQEVGRSDAVPTSPLARLLRSGSTIPRHGR
jgi:hypothetical protein